MFSKIRKAMSERKFLWLGFSIFSIMIVLAAFAPQIAPYNPDKPKPLNRLQQPSLRHPFGTDRYGRDVLSRVIFGARLSLFIGLSVALFVLFFGGISGLFAGYSSLADSIIMRVMDALMAMPSMMLALALVAAFKPGFTNVIVALGITYMPRLARVTRAAVLEIRERTYVEAARALGADTPRILLVHISYNVLSPVLVQLTITFAFSILIEASLSFLGVGVPPYVPSWGSIIAQGRDYLVTAPWLTTFPGIFIVATVLSVNLLGDGIRDVMDPRLKGSLR